MMHRSPLVRTWVLALIVLLGACSSGPTPTPSASERASSSPIISSEPSPSTQPEDGEPPTSADLIKAAVRDGTIDEATGYLYRFYAQWGDGRLPEAYRGGWAEDNEAAHLAEQALDAFSTEQQALLRPFLVRPTDPDSYWDEVVVARQVEPPGAALAIVHDPSQMAPVMAAAACQNGWARLDLPGIPVTIWGRCSGPNLETFSLVDAVGQAATDMEALWTPMTNLMGKPIGDKYRGSTQAADEVAEAGDGRLDIYIIAAPVAYNRDLANPKGGSAHPAPPLDYDTGTASGYIVADPTQAGSAAMFKSWLAHEFFHILQFRHNASDTCAYPASTCAKKTESHWFTEASAMWSEHYFVPEARVPAVYPVFEPFLSTWQSLSDTARQNAYHSFMWPLFMQQESPRHEKSIADAWIAMEGTNEWADRQAAVNAQLPFAGHFRDFAVRVWNEQLTPGDPISPRFQALDPGFPTTQPGMVPFPYRVPEDEVYLDPLFKASYSYRSVLADLWAEYHQFSLAAAAQQAVLDFSGLAPADRLDVDALVKVRDVGWQRRKLDVGETQWCLDRPEDAIEQFIIVISNHSIGPGTGLEGDWTVSTKLEGCSALSGDSLQYSLTSQTGNPGDPYYATQEETLTLRVKLKSGPEGAYVDDGSTYDVRVRGHSELQSVDCVVVGDVAGSESGVVPESEPVVASLYQVFDSDPDGVWVMGISASFNVEATETTDYCALGPGTSTYDWVVQMNSCDGTEVQDGDPARTFDFNCHSTSEAVSWSLVGRVTVQP